MPAREKGSRRKPDDEGQQRFDIRDVASRARVSIATVSRTINGVPTVDKRLAARVWKAVKQLNYYPNTQARALVSGKSKLFGLLISEITNPFFPELIQGFEEIAVSHGYDILISSTSHDPARMEVCIRRLVERKVEGVAVMTFGIEAPLLDQLARRSIPLVLVDTKLANPLSTTLLVAYNTGITQAVTHLRQLGHNHIGFVSGPIGQRSAFLRREAFLGALAASQISPTPGWMIEGDHTLEGGMRAAEQLLALPMRPTAILCSNDMTAIGALRVFARNNVRVPEDISVVGFDNIHLAEFVHPPLTTVQMSRHDLARGAFEALMSAVEEGKGLRRKQQILIPTLLVVRQSTAPVPAGSRSAWAVARPSTQTVARPSTKIRLRKSTADKLLQR
jgi:LacI family transcriptional regulator